MMSSPLRQAHREAADNVQDNNDNGGDRVAAHELVGAVHRAVKVRLALDYLAPVARLLLVD